MAQFADALTSGEALRSVADSDSLPSGWSSPTSSAATTLSRATRGWTTLKWPRIHQQQMIRYTRQPALQLRIVDRREHARARMHFVPTRRLAPFSVESLAVTLPRPAVQVSAPTRVRPRGHPALQPRRSHRRISLPRLSRFLSTSRPSDDVRQSLWKLSNVPNASTCSCGRAT